MEIKVFGSGCDKCGTLYDNVAEAVKRLGLEAQIIKVEDLLEIVMAGILSAPAMTVDGKLVISGRVPNVKTIMGILEKQR